MKPLLTNILTLLSCYYKKCTQRIITSDYGREGWWYVELDNRRIAFLSDPQYEDMFWVSYSIEPLSENNEENRQMLESEEFWQAEFVYRSKQFEKIATNAFPALHPFPCYGRITMRGLYLTRTPTTLLQQ